MINENKKEIFKKIKKEIKNANYKNAFSELKKNSDFKDNFTLQSRFASLYKSIPSDSLDLKKVKVAILGSSTTAHFTDVLKYWLAVEGLDAEIYESEFDTIHQEILNKSSGLYRFNPDITMIFTNHRDVKCNVKPGDSKENVDKAVSSLVNEFVILWQKLKENSSTFIIQNNADIPDIRIFGNYEGNVPWARVNVLRNFNLKLADVVTRGTTIFDIDYISSLYGKERWNKPKYWYHSKHAFDLDAIGIVAYQASKLIGSIKGFSKKCLVLDLDNTIWGGVIGDDGLEGIELGSGVNGEAFVDFQKYILDLKERGIILAVCSKNEEKNAKEPFLKHLDMQIKLDDIAVFIANWDNKANNIKKIAQILNIGLDSLVFVDDNPVERELVRDFLPMVNIPEMPEDPAEFTKTLDKYLFFETISFSDEDKARSKYYKDNAKRKQLETQFDDISEYLKSLEMEAEMGEFDSFNLPRIVQLINKTNQFNLTTIRYTESEVLSMQESENYYCRWFKLKDKFGDNGLISVLITEKQNEETLYIDTWLMSCRVISRSMEEFIMNEIVSLAKKTGCKKIVGKYIPTKKNTMVSKLYERLNFKKIEENSDTTLWEKEINKKTPKYQTFIKKVKKMEMNYGK